MKDKGDLLMFNSIRDNTWKVFNMQHIIQTWQWYLKWLNVLIIDHK